MLKPLSLLVLASSVVSFNATAQELVGIDQIPAGVYELEDSHASLLFKVNHLGLSNYTARFKDFSAEINLDPKDVTKSTLTASVNPASIETDYPNPEKKDFNKKLSEGEDWFNSTKFPEITFTSTKIEKTGDNTGKITGDLSMLGVTKPMTLDVTFNGAYKQRPFGTDPALGFSAHATIKRSEWGFDTYVPAVGDEVDIILETEFMQKAE